MKAEFNTSYMKHHKPNLTLNQGNNPTSWGSNIPLKRSNCCT